MGQSMKLVDLTLPVPEERVVTNDVQIRSGVGGYTGVIHDFSFGSMDGTYIDFPGHIRETDDGLDALTYPLHRLYRVPAAVIHLDRASGSGAVTASDLAAAIPAGAPRRPGALVINALGSSRFDEIEERSVFLSADAVTWIVDLGVHLLVSDIYESRDIHGVFVELFRHGVSTVCLPINLHLLNAPGVLLSVFHVPVRGVVQIPCRVVAELAA